MSKTGELPLPPDHTWLGFEALPEPLKLCHRRFFAGMAGRSPLTLQEYRRAFRALYEFMQAEGIPDLAALTPQHLEAFQRWCYRRHHWTPGNVENLLRRTLSRIGNSLRRLGLLAQNPFAKTALVKPRQETPAQSLSWYRAGRLYFRWLKSRSVTTDVRRQYLICLQRLLRFASQEGSRLPHQIGPDDLKRFEAFLAERPVKSRRHAAAILAPSMRHLTLRQARAFLRWLDREGLIPRQIDPPESSGSPAVPQPLNPLDPWGQVVEEFLTYTQRRYSPITLRRYRKNLARFQQFLKETGHTPSLETITRETLTLYVNALKTQPSPRTGQPMTVSEQFVRLCPVKMFVRYLYRKGYIPQDLQRFVLIPPKEQPVPRTILTPEEMAKLLDAPSETTTLGIRDRAMLELAYLGLRVGEILRLTIPDIELKEDRLTILNSKCNKDRVVPMTHMARYWVGRWLSRRIQFVPKQADLGTLFLSRWGKPLRQSNFHVILRTYAKQAGIQTPVNPHLLRAVTATHLAENGAPVRLLQAFLGHTHVNTTGRYIRLSHEHIQTKYKEFHPSSRRAFHARVDAG